MFGNRSTTIISFWHDLEHFRSFPRSNNGEKCKWNSTQDEFLITTYSEHSSTISYAIHMWKIFVIWNQKNFSNIGPIVLSLQNVTLKSNLLNIHELIYLITISICTSISCWIQSHFIFLSQFVLFFVRKFELLIFKIFFHGQIWNVNSWEYCRFFIDIEKVFWFTTSGRKTQEYSKWSKKIPYFCYYTAVPIIQMSAETIKYTKWKIIYE